MGTLGIVALMVATLGCIAFVLADIAPLRGPRRKPIWQVLLFVGAIAAGTAVVHRIMF